MKKKRVRMHISYRTVFLLFKILKDTYLAADIERFKDFLGSYEIQEIWLKDKQAPRTRDYDIVANFVKGRLELLRKYAVVGASKKAFEILLRIIESTLIEIEENRLGIMICCKEAEKDEKRLLLSLELDGLKYVNRKVIPIESQIVETEQIKDDMVEKIESNLELNSQVLIKHLEDCENNYISRSWKDSISNARHFMEQLLLDIAKASADALGETPPEPGPGEAARARKYLIDKGFFEERESNNLIKGVYSYLSEEGSHRGLTDQTCARVSRSIILSLGFYVLEKFETWKKNKYKQL